MSRSNGPVTRESGQAPHDWHRGAEAEAPAEPGEAAHQPYQWPALAPRQAPYGYSQTDPHRSAAAPPFEPQHAAYHHPQDGVRRPAPPPAGQQPPLFGAPPGQHTPAPAPFEPQFDHYLQAARQASAPPRRHEPAPYPPQPAEHYPNGGLAHLQPQAQQYPAQTSLRDQLRSTQHDQWPAAHDPRDYDLGSYMPAGEVPQSGHRGRPQPAPAEQYDPHWQDQLPYGSAGPQQDPGFYPQHAGEALPVASQPQELQEHDEGDYELDEPRHGRRGLMIVVALVGAIVVGGGLAYGYKLVVGSSSKTSPPVIKADKRPLKTQPADPGGKQFSYSDSKLMGRLEADGTGSGAQGASASESDAGGVRKVPTITVGRDGSIAPPAAEPRLPPPTVSVPGMTIVDGFGGRGPAPLPPPRSAEPVRAEPVRAAPAPVPQAEPQPAARVAAAVAPAAPTPAQKKPAVREAVEAAAPSAPRTSTAGYVAVLASQRSRMEALKAFADLQQKYVNVLQNKIPDVQEADLSARGLGTMYRVVVGPPGSREAAANLCGQLKTAGFSGCWVTAY